mgnify:CR=1 FL=1
MQQYMRIKEENKDAILFFRLGDFYEMFFDDALTASRELEIALTRRECGLEDKAPMCGIPHHVSEPYINKLVSKGYKVAVVDQIEDPKLAKGLVKRSITRLVTPGTLIDLDMEAKKDNNFLASIFHTANSFGISYIDITTGELKTTEITNSIDPKRDLLDFLVKINPREIIINKRLDYKYFNNYVENKNIFISVFEPRTYEASKNLDFLSGYLDRKSLKLIDKKIYASMATSSLLDYVYLFQEEKLAHIESLDYVEANRFLQIDANTRENLELHRNLNDGSRKNTLLSVLDKSKTAMGSRKINSWLEFPLIKRDEIDFRLNVIEYFSENTIKRMELLDLLSTIYDLERILSKVAYGRANARDLLALKTSIENIPKIIEILREIDKKEIKLILESFDSLEDIYQLIDQAIVEDAPTTITEGDLIKQGFDEKLDKLKYQSIEGKRLLLEYEEEEKRETGIKNLKVSYNKNTGYYIELTKSNIGSAPDHYIRRQTLKNSERYITDRLNEISDMILGSQADTVDLEYEIFNGIRSTISENTSRIKNTSNAIANLDGLLTLAQVAIDNNYVRPSFNDENIIDIKDGRHPVIETSIQAVDFIPNDSLIGQEDNLIQIITGPNMAGKSTYMRQVALIIIMGHMGSFVPATSANLSVCDAIFTRIGASDNLAKGESTFMVEMKEMSNIIKNATDKSFIVLDEVGRGTSTNDGLSIAYAIVEYISENLRAKTLFATHYHELTLLEENYENIVNLKVDIDESQGNLVFLRKILKGRADKSYGIEVAKLSGIPDQIIKRANYILKNIDNMDFSKTKLADSPLVEDYRDFEKNAFLEEIKSLNLDHMTAKEAYDFLYDMKDRLGDIVD